MAKKKGKRGHKSSEEVEEGQEKYRDEVTVDQAPEEAGEAEEEADLSLCDASFRAEDAVPTSGHEMVSRCTESQQHFLAAVQAHFDKSQEFDFEESLGTLTPDEMTALWTSINQYLTGCKQDQEESQEIIVGVVMVMKFSVNLETISPDFCPPGLVSTAHSLHNMFCLLYTSPSPRDS